MKSFKILWIIFLFSLGLNAQTHKNVDKQSLVWMRYYNQLELNKKWSVHTEMDNRVFINPIVQNAFVGRVQARSKITDKLELGAGFVFSSVATQNPEAKTGFSIPEYRLQQDAILKQPLGNLNLTHRYRIEERFIANSSKLELEDGTTFYLRFRYQIQADYAFWKKEKQYLKAILSDEIMLNGGNKIIKSSFDQNRVYAAVQWGLSPAVALELGYLNSFQERANGVDYFNRDILRMSFIHKIKI
ncbi:DUF2490 domain-containing protein [Flavobacterium crassostreae]|uniref:DUF2490 domain-containing protein n=1 Tax=Flavobacterium crassostreae TaxID=1763534 RepID=A0A1B9DZQ2_9FLAO|nr:DUF2490 domain-containing protein [Flavobacterium crassostreae]OCB75159.1 hypothetical protein LPBF_08855 [Flavobacterium crassostreae]